MFNDLQFATRDFFRLIRYLYWYLQFSCAYPVNNTKTGCSCEFRPIGRSSEPLEIISTKKWLQLEQFLNDRLGAAPANDRG